MTDRDDAAWNRPDAPPPAWQPPPPQQPQPPPPHQPGPAQGSWNPGGYQQPPPPYPQPGGWQPGPAPTAARPTNTMAILALVFAFVFPPAGLVLGFLARQQIQQRNEGGEGLAMAGLIIGAIGTIGYVVLCAASASTGY
ncbi:DUF4190 domain-containing protein [Actinoplanes sp. NPDC051513]|uniref:DUF4190 domain-containing protein n=1 Tax=Actinoplanes sp. NPDC051513 TaxID=3363908 RepID=UPI0037AD3E66